MNKAYLGSEPLLKTIDGRFLTREQAVLEQRQMAETNPHGGRQPIPKRDKDGLDDDS